jgi:hypothetical protein
MNTEHIHLDSLLEKYKKTRSIPGSVRSRIVDTEKKNYKTIMKRLGRYNPYIAAVAFIYFTLKKLGISVTFTKSVIILCTISILGGTAITTGIVITIKHIQSEKVKTSDSVKQIEEQSLSIPQKDQKETIKFQFAVRLLKTTLAIGKIGGTSTDDTELNVVKNAIYSEFIRLRGSNNITRSAQGAKLSITGELRHVDNQYHISVRLFENETGRIIGVINEVSTKEALPKTSQKIAKELSDSIE